MSSFISALQTQSALNFANFIVRSPSTFAASGLAAGIPANFFVVNPGVSEAFLVDNSNRSYYDGLQVEYRRRLSRGILVDASYVFSKSLTNYYASNPEVFKNFISLHDPRLDRGISPFDITHAFKTRFIYDLPVGHGHKLIGGDNGIVSRVFSGWTIAGTSRIQSGTPFSLGNVQLIGMTGQQLQDMVKIRHTVSQSFFINGVGTPVVTYLPDNIIQGTIAAFNGQLPTTSQYIAPAGLGTLVPFPGAAGYSNLVLHGPRFTRFDLSVIKRTKINDKVNFEFRAEFLNAFNNVNFMVTDPSSDVGTVGAFNSNTFGQVPFSYSDLIDTNDPGGRIIQFVAKINF
ncbi:MAG TPA: hypothetical protein VFC63_23560, partial [Blastocatellia bacterium]|nr:hypothetical protein [Blastocatellia bacterium]